MLNVISRHLTLLSSSLLFSSFPHPLHLTMKSISQLLLLLLVLANAPFKSAAFAFIPLPSKITLRSPSVRPVSVGGYTTKNVQLFLSEDEINQLSDVDSSPSYYTPADRPVLAAVDVVGLIIFALIGKSSHSADGSIDLAGVLSTALPFVSSWLATSPLTGVYSPDQRGSDTSMVTSTAIKVAKGWAVAVPLGIVMRGVLKGYVPPVPFIIVTMISTLVILAGIRIVFNVLENFFVELV